MSSFVLHIYLIYLLKTKVVRGTKILVPVNVLVIKSGTLIIGTLEMVFTYQYKSSVRT